MDWSIDGQTPEFLAATRMISLADTIVRSILADLRLEGGMRVLDVGSGSGEYCFRLGSALEGVAFTGLEYDEHFVEFAQARAHGEVGYPFEVPNPANEYRFVCGDGLDLPFPDESFDAVISHTYLTALPDWAAALAEMCRVCKPGGTVSSVTSLTDDFYGTGTIELFSGLLDPADADVVARVNAAKDALFGTMLLASGIAPRKAPVAFDWIGLENVHCIPIGQYFCLSDANTGIDDYIRYVDLLCAMERKQLARLAAIVRQRAPSDAPSASDLARYAELIEQRRDFLIGSIGCNREWSWYGNASLLVSGTVPAGGMTGTCAEFRAATRKARCLLATCEDAGLDMRYTTEQLGYGRCVEISFTVDDEPALIVCGFDPPSAIEEGCAKLIARTAEQRFEARENGIVEASADIRSLPPYPDKRLFEDARIWETVSEAAFSGISVTFLDAGTREDLCAIACIAETPSACEHAVSAHVDPRQAARRALARALGKLKAEGKPR